MLSFNFRRLHFLSITEYSLRAHLLIKDSNCYNPVSLFRVKEENIIKSADFFFTVVLTLFAMLLACLSKIQTYESYIKDNK